MPAMAFSSTCTRIRYFIAHFLHHLVDVCRPKSTFKALDRPFVEAGDGVARSGVRRPGEPLAELDAAGSIPVARTLFGAFRGDLQPQSGYSSFRHARGSAACGFGALSSSKLKYGATNGSGADTVYVW